MLEKIAYGARNSICLRPRLAFAMDIHYYKAKWQRPNTLQRYSKELREAFKHDMDDFNVVCVGRGRVKYAFGSFIQSSTRANFPVATVELEAAGRCYALFCHTACVFHAMRSLESPLKLLAGKVGVKLGKNMKGQSWGAILQQIESAVKGMQNSK